MTEKNTESAGAETPEEKPVRTSQKAINADYAKASAKEKLSKFVVDPSTRTLRRA